MISIFSIPKPFRGEDEKRQRNALESWIRLEPTCEIILLGNESGIEEAAEEYGTRWIGNIKRNKYGTPLLDDAFKKASDIAEYSILCYTNADIILFDDLPEAVKNISYDRFLASARRYHINLLDSHEQKKVNDYAGLKDYAKSEGTLDFYYSMDIFLFQKKTNFELPPFTVGRPGWDQWMIYRARQLRLPVIDMTEVVTVVHQVHDYKHVPGAKDNSWRGPEADENFRLIKDRRHHFNLKSSTHKLTQRGLKKTWRRKSVSYWRNEKLVLYPKWNLPIRFVSSIMLFLRKIIRKTS